jgi:hypothetical protein
MVDPEHYDDLDAPTLHGHALPEEVLTMMYEGTARQLGLVDAIPSTQTTSNS